MAWKSILATCIVGAELFCKIQKDEGEDRGRAPYFLKSYYNFQVKPRWFFGCDRFELSRLSYKELLSSFSSFYFCGIQARFHTPWGLPTNWVHPLANDCMSLMQSPVKQAEAMDGYGTWGTHTGMDCYLIQLYVHMGLPQASTHTLHLCRLLRSWQTSSTIMIYINRKLWQVLPNNYTFTKKWWPFYCLWISNLPTSCGC